MGWTHGQPIHTLGIRMCTYPGRLGGVNAAAAGYMAAPPPHARGQKVTTKAWAEQPTEGVDVSKA